MPLLETPHENFLRAPLVRVNVVRARTTQVCGRCSSPDQVMPNTLGVLVRLPSPAHPPFLEKEKARPKIGGSCFLVIYLFVIASEIAWWEKGNVRQPRESSSGLERASHVPGASDLQQCVRSLSLEHAPQFPGADD